MKQGKKHIALALVFAIVFSLLVPAFGALASYDYSDHVQEGDIPANILKDPANLNSFTNTGGGAGTMYRGENNSWDSLKMFGYYEKTHSPDGWFGAGPSVIGISYLSDTITKGENYVVSVRLANGAPDKKATLKAAVSYATACTPVRFDVSSDEFITYKGAFTAQKDATNLSFGFDTTADRSSVTDDTRGLLLYDYSDGGSLYVAKEKAHDLIITTSSLENLVAGSVVSVSTDVVNQLGIEGNLSQSVTYKVLNADRTSETDDLYVVQSADGAVDIVVGDNVTQGRYVIFVSSDNYELQKGIPLEVLDLDAYREYTPGSKPANQIENPYNINSFTGSNGAGGTRTNYAGESYVNLVEKYNTDSSRYFGAGPVNITGLTIENGKNYVVSVYVRNASGSTAYPLLFGFNYMTNTAPISIPVTSSEFTEQNFTFTAQRDATSMWFGFDAATDNSYKTESELGSLHISMAPDQGMYFAEEVPYDIKVESYTDAQSTLNHEETLTLKASTVNQTGTAGKLNQEFEWCVLANGRTQFADNVFATCDDNDSSLAVVTIASDAPSGTYHVVAKSTEYPELVRSYPIVVGAKEDYVPTEKPANLFPQRNLNKIDGYTESNGSGGVRQPYNDGETYINIVEKGTYDSWFGAGPVYKALSAPLTAGENYVVSVNVRNASADITPTLYFGFNHKTAVAPVSIPVSNTEFENKKFVFTALGNATYVSFGIDATKPAKTENLGTMHIDFSEGNEPYIAKEVAYEIKTNITEGDTAVIPGESVTLSATLLNQLGIEGSLSQDFEWHILDSNKAHFRGDFALDVSDDTKSATVTAGDQSVADTYYIAVNPKAYPEMTKLVELRVKKNGFRCYVSPNGDDDADGTIYAPFKTIEKARDVVSAVTDKDSYDSIEVILRGGEYRTVKSIQFTNANSGTEETPIVYRAYEGETPVIKGSALLDVSGAREPLSEDIVKRMRPEVQGKLIVFDLAENGISKSQILDLTQNFASFYELTSSGEQNTLFIDGTEQTISCWPNAREYATRGDAIVSTNSAGEQVSRSFRYIDSQPDRWTKAQDWYIGAYIPYDYAYARMSGMSVDTQNKIISLDSVTNDSDYNITNNFTKRWKAFNLLEEIDLPGEYYLDTVNGHLYLYPPYDISDSKVEITLNSGNLADITNAQNITFRGITFAQSGNSAMRMGDVRNIDIDSCTFSGIQGVAVVVYGSKKAQTNKDYWQRQTIDGSYDMDITNNVFVNIGSNAISINGGNVDTLTPSGNIIENNFVSNYATKTTNQLGGAFAISGCGHTIRHNHIGNSVSAAINVDGNDHVIEYNEMYNLLYEYQDAGVVYQGKNALARGTVIRYNYIHDNVPTREDMTDSSQVAIYVDDAQHGITAENNIIKNTKLGFHSNGGGALTVKGNTVIDAQGRPWSFINQPNGYTANPTVTKGPGGTVEFISSQLYDRELYFEKYEGLMEFVQDGKNPKYYTVIKDNFSVNSGSARVDTEERRYSSVLDNTEIGNSDYSMFADAANQDYRIKSDSPYAMETRLTEDNFDIDKIGIQNDFALSGNISAFRQLYPANGAKVVPENGKITLSWTEAAGAVNYDVAVASDKEFSNIIYTENVRANTISISAPINGTYYWKVTANNTSRELNHTWESQNGALIFDVVSHEDNVTLLDTSVTENQNEVTVKSKVINNTVSDTCDFAVSVAVYSDGKFMDVEQFAITLPIGASYDLAHTIDTQGNYDIDEIKILVWQKDTVMPLRQVRVLK